MTFEKSEGFFIVLGNVNLVIVAATSFSAEPSLVEVLGVLNTLWDII